MASISAATSSAGAVSPVSSALASADQTRRSTAILPVSCTRSPTKETTTPVTDRPPTTPSSRNSECRRRNKSHRLLRSEECAPSSCPSSVPRKRKRPASPQVVAVVSQVQDFYTVESVLSERRVDGETQFLVKWLNYDDTTWEPVSSLKECPHVLKEFRHLHRSGAPSSPPPQQSPLQSALS